MTYAPATMTALAKLWTTHGGDNLGIVGDPAHAARASYHNGFDRAVARYGTSEMIVIAARDYTFRLKRDQVKSNAAMGFDFGKLDGSLPELRAFSRWFKNQLQAGAPGSADVREFIYSPDGKNVYRWDNIDKVLRPGYPVATGQGDSSHLWHSHLSCLRDSESRDKTKLIAPYFGGDIMPISLFETPRMARLTADAVLYDDPALSQVAWKDLDQKNPDGSDRYFLYVGTVDADVVVLGYEPVGGDTSTRSPAVYAKKAHIAGSVVLAKTVEKIVEVPTGITQEQVDAAAAAAAAAEKDRIALAAGAAAEAAIRVI